VMARLLLLALVMSLCGVANAEPGHPESTNQLLAEAKAMLEEYGLPTSGEEALKGTPRDRSVGDLGESQDAVVTVAARDAFNRTMGGAPNATVPKVPPSTLKSTGQYSTSPVDATAATGTTYHSLNPFIEENLKRKDKEATADYIGTVKDDGIWGHLWRKQFRNVMCEMKGSIDMSVCWDPAGNKTFKSTPGAIGSVGMGGHHSASCDPIIKMQWSTQLWHNISALRIDEVVTANTAYVPAYEARKVENFEKDLASCKVWYMNIEAPLEQLLSKIRHQQTLCALDSTMLDRDQDCWRVVNTANGGAPNGNTTVLDSASDADSVELGSSATIDHAKDSASVAARDSITEFTDEEQDYEDNALGAAMFREALGKSVEEDRNNDFLPPI